MRSEKLSPTLVHEQVPCSSIKAFNFMSSSPVHISSKRWMYVYVKAESSSGIGFHLHLLLLQVSKAWELMSLWASFDIFRDSIWGIMRSNGALKLWDDRVEF